MKLTFIKVLKDLLVNKKMLILSVLLGFIFGFLITYTFPNIYNSRTTFLPQISVTGSQSQLSGIASLAGIRLSSGNDNSEISPTMYKEIVESHDFKLQIINA